MAKLHDKTELRLNNKQLLFLLLGMACVGAILFLLGYMAGQAYRTDRYAAAPPHPPASPTGDPIAQAIEEAQDGAAPSAAGEVTFPKALTSPEVKEDFQAPSPPSAEAPVMQTRPTPTAADLPVKRIGDAKSEEATAGKPGAGKSDAAPWAVKPKPDGNDASAAKVETIPEPQPEPIETVQPTPTPPKPLKPSTGGFVIQAASTRAPEAAAKLAADLRKAGFDAEIEPFMKGTEDWHRIVVRGYANRAAAQRDADTLTQKFRLKPFVRAAQP